MSIDLDWLNLLEVSGPFLAEPVLKQAFPDGLDLLDYGAPQRLRATYDEWRNAVDLHDPDLSLFHEAWIDEVLTGALELDETCIRKGSELPDTAKADLPEHGVHLDADIAIVDPSKPDVPILLISTYAPDTDLDAVFEKDGLAASPADRMMMLSRRTECPLGLVTNGERWMLVHAPSGSVASFTSWYARLWGQERETLRAFVSLLGIRRLTGPAEDALPSLFERSLAHQGDVTDALGGQVAQAIEVLMRALDRADQDRNRELLKGVPPETIYEAGLTLMMRLVFVLSAEERGLLLLGDPTYDAHYAISSLRAQLAEEDAKVLEHRMSAWSRILATFRAVYAGIGHPDFHMPAMGGSLFDPDRFEFLEGRKRGTTWRTEPADPLPIDDRTVLLLLEAIQTFKGRTLSYRALDVEQIGHVYEGLLERTVDHVHGVTLQLKASTNVGTCLATLRELEQARESGQDALIEFLEDRTERSQGAIGNDLPDDTDQSDVSGLLSSCRGDVALRDRILPFVRLIETDPWGFPLVHHEGAIVVVHGSDRRETGTHYTPKSLTEKIVEETLDPVVYRGPAEGVPRAEWQLKTPTEILDLKICDPAMGSGAFLVQVCRWLAERLLESWASEEDKGRHIDVEGHVLEDANDVSEPLPRDPEERATLARRMIAEKCLYGVDMNPLAVELAKLSLWLTTLAKGRPFGFLDHNLKSGDSLLGISNLEQLIELDVNPKQRGQLRLFGRSIRKSVEDATALRSRLREIPVRDITDVEAMAQLDSQSRRILDLPKLVGDAFVGGVLANKKAADRNARIETIAALSDDAAAKDASAIVTLERLASEDLAKDEPNGRPRRPFHWPLEFPEVFDRENGGFNAFVGNPPFMGGKKITSAFGDSYRDAVVVFSANGQKGAADLSAYFFLRVNSLISTDGSAGLIGTDSIATGDTAIVGLKKITSSGSTIHFANSSQKWPGSAQTSVCLICFRKGDWRGEKVLDGNSVENISWHLSSDQDAGFSSQKLKGMVSESFAGTYVNGEGFILSPQAAQDLIKKDPENSRVIKPYLGGDDINSNFQQIASRFVIDFGTMTKPQASHFQDCFAIVTEKVKPYRDTLTKQIHEPDYWKFWDKRIASYKKISSLSNVLVAARASKFVQLAFVENDQIFSDQVVVFVSNSFRDFAVLQSNIHAVWAWHLCTKMGQSTIRYAPSKAVATFPAPASNTDLDKVGISYHDVRRKLENFHKEGLTKIYNRMHDPSNCEAEVVRFREEQKLLDEAVASSFHWDDLHLEHDFHEVPYLPENDRVRFTVSEPARAEILRRLSNRNAEQHQTENQQGPLGKRRSKKPANQPRPGLEKSTSQTPPMAVSSLFEAESLERNESVAAILAFLRLRPGRHSKPNIFQAVRMTSQQWTEAIEDLINQGLVVREGNAPNETYKISEST